MTEGVPLRERELVLIIDDDKARSRALEETLASGRSCTVKMCGGVEALSVLDTVTPDLILLDRMVDLFHGGLLLGMIRHCGRLRGVPVVMLSPEATVSHKADAFEAGASGFLAKPFEGDELLAEVGWQLARVSRVTA